MFTIWLPEMSNDTHAHSVWCSSPRFDDCQLVLSTPREMQHDRQTPAYRSLRPGIVAMRVQWSLTPMNKACNIMSTPPPSPPSLMRVHTRHHYILRSTRRSLALVCLVCLHPSVYQLGSRRTWAVERSCRKGVSETCFGRIVLVGSSGIPRRWFGVLQGGTGCAWGVWRRLRRV